LKQVFIINKFNPKKLYPSEKALRELERMNRVSINENPDPWSKKSENTLKIVSLNCSGLKAHFQDIKTDDRLLKADIIHLVECSLTDEDNKDEFSLEGYNQQFITIGPGKGIATYFKNDRFNPAEEVLADKFQITKFKHEIMDIVSVYRSQSGHSLELLEGLMKMIEAGRITIITGDFNICFMENFSNRMTQGLLSMGFNQLVHEPTQIQGRHIDQVYFLDQSNRLQPIVDRYSPYYSDHDGICITIPELIHKKEG
jgi:exonuclease III